MRDICYGLDFYFESLKDADLNLVPVMQYVTKGNGKGDEW